MKKLIFFFIFFLICVHTYSQSGWYAENSGTSNTLYSAYFIDGLTGWAAGANGTIIKTINGGNSYSAQNYQNTHYYCSHFFSSNTGIIGGANGVIIRTTNGGSSWNSVSTGVSD